jgi:glycosyltransferase involved in cell wall biosynthesis
VTTRILYILPSPGGATGGNKVSFRHVEALSAMGYDARVRIRPGQTRPWWFTSSAPVEETDRRPDPGDILVFPEDDPDVLAAYASLPNRKVVFCQNPYYAVKGVPALPRDLQAAYRTFMACSPGVAAWIARYLDYDVIATVPAFADERLFRPLQKAAVIACMPRKRPLEQRVIQHLFERQYAGGLDWRWEIVERRTEAEAAQALGSASVFLSLARHEGMSLTIVEAMACEWAARIHQPAEWPLGRGGRLRSGGRRLAPRRAACRGRRGAGGPYAPRRARDRRRLDSRRIRPGAGDILARRDGRDPLTLCKSRSRR